MTLRRLRVLTACALAFLAAGLAPAEEPKPVDGSSADGRGRRLLAEKLATLTGAERGQVVSVVDPTLERLFPRYLWYVLRFRQYPVALVPPDPLRANNIFVVRPDGSVGHFTESRALEAEFRSALAPLTIEADAKDAARAWLRLAEELHQDGFRQFSIPDQSLRVVSRTTGGQEATGEAIVIPHGGDSGKIVASLTFDEHGRLVSVSETTTMKRGIRPRCQATKLLDPDPTVRAMAEQAILIMGKTAKPYLDEQHAAASPALRRSIDRLWQQIVSEDR